MGDNSNIEWCTATWNVVTGCNKVSPGCAHCYAEGVTKRFWKDRPFEDVQFHEDRLDQPLQWKRPRRIFVNSMSDLFHENVTDSQIYSIMDIMHRAQKHTFQVLTKRPARMRDIMKWTFLDSASWLPNVWLGVSVENQRMANERIPILLSTPAAVRFVSAEPLLDSVYLRTSWMSENSVVGLKPLDWIICGGESGPKARPCDLSDVYRIVQNCRDFSIPCFVKQLGRRPVLNGVKLKLKSAKGGDVNEWPTEFRVREFPL